MSREDYLAGIDWIRLRAPSHPLLRTLDGGYSPMNVIYMKHALEQVGQPEETRPGESAEVVVDEMDPQLLIWYKERRTLFVHRAKLSNRFHDCHSDSERAIVSSDIQQVQRSIGPLLRRINHYKETGEILDDDKPKEVELTGIELMKKMRSTTSNISNYRRYIKNNAHRTDEATVAKLKKWERKLKELEREKLRLERSLARESV